MTITKKEINAAPLLKNIEAVKINVDYPRIEGVLNKKAEKRINKFYIDIAKDYTKYTQKKLLNFYKKAYKQKYENSFIKPVDVSQTYGYYIQDDRFFSVLYTQKEVSPFGEKRVKSFADVWDLNTGEILNMKNILKKYGINKKKALKAIKTDLERRKEYGVSFNQKGLKRRLRSKFNPQNTFITDEGISIFYNPSDLKIKNRDLMIFKLFNLEKNKTDNNENMKKK